MSRYIRPLVQVGAARPENALTLAAGWGWFTHVEILSRDAPSVVASIGELSNDERLRLTNSRQDIAGLSFDAPVLMGILNVTPDSFSDGGRHNDVEAAVEMAQAMTASGATLIDIGGESTRPGAALVAVDEEIKRTAPVIQALRRAGIKTPISIDTRKAAVGQAALDAGADLVNDVSGFTFEPDLVLICANQYAPVCVMHAQGDPATMQDDPQYDNVVLDVYDFLEQRITELVQLGISRDGIIVDPGIGFGKTQNHNLEILNRISVFHSLGVPILLGASRKGVIGKIGNEPHAEKRASGSVGVALAAIAQGIQLIRAHDVAEHAQAIALWRASVSQG
ncbi:MAG: dihydropteroate synthase [Lentilitoribacter sp.]